MASPGNDIWFHGNIVSEHETIVFRVTFFSDISEIGAYAFVGQWNRHEQFYLGGGNDILDLRGIDEFISEVKAGKNATYVLSIEPAIWLQSTDAGEVLFGYNGSIMRVQRSKNLVKELVTLKVKLMEYMEVMKDHVNSSDRVTLAITTVLAKKWGYLNS